MTPSESPLPFWTLVGKLQRTANNTRLDYRSWVADEQLFELLKRHDQSDLAPDEVAMFGRQTRYRTRKLFDRARKLRAFAERRAAAPERVDTTGDAETVRRLVSSADWVVLSRLAGGTSYEVIAAERGVSVGALKSHVSRLRAEVRRRCPMATEAR